MSSKKPAQLERKYSIDNFKYAKPDVSTNPNEQISVLGLQKNGRAEPILQDLNNASAERSRAAIVAAVTRRLYSHGKKLAEEVRPPVAVQPIVEDPVEVVQVVEEPPPPSPVLEVPAMTKIRLQEISRKMLAKRRRIIVDTQTDFYESTTRVKDVYTITDKIKQADAEVLTDEHQDLPNFRAGLINVTRVKEIATLTEKLSTAIIRFKDATCVTENDDYDSSSVPSHAETRSKETNVGTTFEPQNQVLIDGSTNTVPDNPGPSPLTVEETKVQKDVGCEHMCRSCGRTLVDEQKKQEDQNVITITMPEDLVRITVETSNKLESKITVVEDAGEPKVEKVYRDSETQTDPRKWSFANPFFNKYYSFLRGRRFSTRTYGSSPPTSSRLRSSFDDLDDGNSLSSTTSCDFWTSTRSYKRTESPTSSRPIYTSSYSTVRCRKSYPKSDIIDKLLTRNLDQFSRTGNYDKFVDLFAEEIEMNVPNQPTDLSRYSSLGNRHNIYSRTYLTCNTVPKSWYSFKK